MQQKSPPVTIKSICDALTGQIRLTVGDSPDNDRLISTCSVFDNFVLNWHLYDICPFVLEVYRRVSQPEL
jgi:hypothetical protein